MGAFFDHRMVNESFDDNNEEREREREEGFLVVINALISLGKIFAEVREVIFTYIIYTVIRSLMQWCKSVFFFGGPIQFLGKE